MLPLSAAIKSGDLSSACVFAAQFSCTQQSYVLLLVTAVSAVPVRYQQFFKVTFLFYLLLPAPTPAIPPVKFFVASDVRAPAL